MKLTKLLLPLVAVAIMSQAALPLDAEPTFRKTTWGMSQEQVTAAEGDNFTSYEGSIGYERSILGLDCYLFYYFTQEKLTTAAFAITEEHFNKNMYFDDLNKLKTGLTKKYGEPTKDDWTWLNSLYADDQEQFGLAVSVGHLTYHGSWSTPETNILLVLKGDNFEVSLHVMYESIELKGLKEAEQEAENLEDL